MSDRVRGEVTKARERSAWAVRSTGASFGADRARRAGIREDDADRPVTSDE